jgi:hypothetical protein
LSGRCADDEAHASVCSNRITWLGVMYVNCLVLREWYLVAVAD